MDDAAPAPLGAPGGVAVEVAGLRKRYGDVCAVDGVSFEIRSGEVFGLLGPNGAGKTTMVEILEGYRCPDAGSVRVLGLDPWRDGRALRPRIGVMLQEGGLYPGVRPLELLRSFAAMYDHPEAPAALLERVGLTDARRTFVRRLSGGQRQRLSLALALVGRPELVFLDEPTAGMDPHARATTRALIGELADRGVTVVLTTHAIDEAEQLCDRVAIVDHGRVVAAGTPSELTSGVFGGGTGAGGVVAGALEFRATPTLDLPALAAALHVAPDRLREERAGEYVVDAPATPELVADLAVWLRDKGASLQELRTGRSSLEAVFLHLTGEGSS